MGLEDHEWWREERRQQGHNASWDNFRVKPDPRLPTLAASELLRIQRPTKLATPPSYLHLHEQHHEARTGSKTSIVLLILGAVACGAMVVVGYFVF